MSVPGSQEICRPLLEIFKDEKPLNFVISEFVESAAEKLDVKIDELSAAEKTAFRNNVNDAVSYLLKNKLLSHPSKTTYLITRAGLENLGEIPEESEPLQDFESDEGFLGTDNENENENNETEIKTESENEDLTMNENAEQELLETTEELNEIEETEPDITGFENDEGEIEDEANEAGEADEAKTKPEETAVEPAKDLSQNLSIEEMLEKYNDTLAGNVAERIEALNQDNFCMLVMDLLSKMGYRAFQNARYTNEAEGSDLIQGIILENKAGMNPIYIHAKKLSRSKTVSKSEMLDFVNAISDKGGKGMFITVGKFSESAENAAKDEGIMLVDGEKLAGLMISNNFCVSTERTFEVKAIDDESFSEYEN